MMMLIWKYHNVIQNLLHFGLLHYYALEKLLHFDVLKNTEYLLLFASTL